jgi:hypothetical protein
MIITHLVLFCSNELFSVIVLLVPFIVGDTKAGKNEYIVSLAIAEVSSWPMMFFIAYLLAFWRND